ncbi:MAG TPA: DUF4288 domain-containing protein [Polyangiaceae bacterium]|nr:DUF4288 domain-containing protein [Polyangiaceae bacterium]
MANWYSVKSLYRMDVKAAADAAPRLSSSEERIILVRADSFDEALEKAQQEARKYADMRWLNARGEAVETRYLEVLDAFMLFDEELADGSEVYSKMLWVAPSSTDEELIERGFGSVAEQTSEDGDSFEPGASVERI